MADRRSYRSTSPGVRARMSRDTSFEEQERQRIRQLKESLLRNESPSTPSYRYSTPTSTSRSREVSETVSEIENGGLIAQLTTAGFRSAIDGRAAEPVELVDVPPTTTPAPAVEVLRADDGPLTHRLFTDGEMICCRCLRSPPSSPILLSCGHRLCSSCGVELFNFHAAVDRLIQRDAAVDVRCLDCGAITTVSDVAHLTGRIDAEPSSRNKCCVCGVQEGSITCFNCMAPFCPTCCTEFHGRSEHFQRHKWGDTKSSAPKKRCANHAKQLDMFCITCSKPACARCFLADDGSHKGHVASSLESAATPAASQLRIGIAAVKDSADKLQNIVAQLKSAGENITKLHDDGVDSVKQLFTEIRASLQQREAALIADLDATRDSKLQALAAQSVAIGAISSELRTTAAAAEKTSDLPPSSARDLSVLSLTSRIEQRKNMVGMLEPKYRPQVSLDLRVEFPKEGVVFDRFGVVLK